MNEARVQKESKNVNVSKVFKTSTSPWTFLPQSREKILARPLMAKLFASVWDLSASHIQQRALIDSFNWHKQADNHKIHPQLYASPVKRSTGYREVALWFPSFGLELMGFCNEQKDDGVKGRFLRDYLPTIIRSPHLSLHGRSQVYTTVGVLASRSHTAGEHTPPHTEITSTVIWLIHKLQRRQQCTRSVHADNK